MLLFCTSIFTLFVPAKVSMTNSNPDPADRGGELFVLFVSVVSQTRHNGYVYRICNIQWTKQSEMQ